MPDTIGNIPVPEIPVAQNPFPITPDYPYGRVLAPDVAVHQFGSANAKIEQRFLLGNGARRFVVRRAWLRDSDRIALRTFWEARQGPYGAFTYNAPNDDGIGTTPYNCRFANEPLSWEMIADHVYTLGVTLIEIPSATPAYTVDATATRVAPGALQVALLSQVAQKATQQPAPHRSRTGSFFRTMAYQAPGYLSCQSHKKAPLEPGWRVHPGIQA
ncbi:MAG TPA: hypothetical protein VN442_23595 [Bryobacteraceae bacterium]|nr:hypothetical protein [Bryobacteraceae bacterium]